MSRNLIPRKFTTPDKSEKARAAAVHAAAKKAPKKKRKPKGPTPPEDGRTK